MPPDDLRNHLWHALRQPDAGLSPRIIASLITAFVLAAMAVVCAWGYVYVLVGRNSIREEDIGFSLGVAALIWIFLQSMIWKGVRRGLQIGRAVLFTVGVWTAVGLACVFIAETIRREEEFLILAVALLGWAVTLLVWSPLLLKLTARHKVVTSDDLVDVHCPACGYALIGLRELRCPECGMQFTIDELIRAQHYDGARPHGGPANGNAAQPLLRP